MMENSGNNFSTPPETDPHVGGGGGGGRGDIRLPLMNLSTVRTRMDSLQRFLTDSVNGNTLLRQDQMRMVSAEITSAIHQIIVNGAALLACSQVQPPEIPPPPPNHRTQALTTIPNSAGCAEPSRPPVTDLTKEEVEETKDEVSDDYLEIIELDAVELLAEHIHFCEICGKGFKRDANLRMHMRAHGNQFKTAEALAKPDKISPPTADSSGVGVGERKTRFSCPYVGCNRNKQHKKFRPLKSVICVKNHFKRSHCPKMYSCNRCNKKSFSVLADLKSHLKHCGESRWRCTCGTTFSRKDKLFGHMALFEGHMPAVMDEDEKNKREETEGKVAPTEKEDVDNGLFEGLLFDGFDSIEGYCLQDMLGSSNSNGGFDPELNNDFFNF